MLLISLNEFAINLISNGLFLWLFISWTNSRQSRNSSPINMQLTRFIGTIFVSQLAAFYVAIPVVNYLLAIVLGGYLINLFSSCGWNRSLLIALLSNAGSLALISLIRLIN